MNGNMKPRIFDTNLHEYAMIICGIAVLFFVGLAAEPALAEENINVNLRIETPNQTILNQQISLPYSCEVTDSAGVTSTYEGYKAICALQSAQEQGLLIYSANNFGWGLFIEKINNIGNDANMFWSLYQNNSASMVGATDLALSVDDKIVLSYVDWNYSNEILQVVLSSSTIYTNSSTTMQAQAWNNTEFTNFDSPVSFFINGTAYDTSSGVLEYTPDTDGQKEIYAEAVGKTRSEKQTINVIPAAIPMPEPTQTTVNLNLRYQNNLIFSNQVTLPTSTTILDNAGIEHFTTSTNALTALLAADATSTDFHVSDLQYYDAYNSFYVNCIETTATTTPLCANWNYVMNNTYPSVGMDQYILTGNENIYIYFDNPWKITASTSTFAINTTTTLQTWRYNYDNLENEWTADANNLIDISIPNPNPTGWWDNTITIAAATTDDTGVVDYLFSTTGTFYAKITSPDWTKWSNPITLTVLAPPFTPTSTPPQDNPPNNSGGGGGGGNNNDQPPTNPIISDPDIKSTVDKILAYLKSQQDTTGKIIDGGITDWAIMAFASAGVYSDEVKKDGASLLDYAQNYNFSDASDLNLCAAYPRHILALLAGGIDKTNAKITGLKNKINSQCINEAAYGQNGINDDIFGLFALLATDEDITTTSIQNIITAIKSDQTAAGAFTWAGWPGADITGGAVNALKYAETKGASIEQEIYSKAKNYLKTNQLNDGGWGYGVSDALTTGWALMGIDALGETQVDWLTSTTTPWHVLVNQLNDTGYYESAWAPGTVDWFATKHAVPALMGKSWPIVLTPKQSTEPAKQNTNTTASAGTSDSTIQSVETTTSTALVITTPTSTISTPTPSSTLEQVVTSTVVTTTLDITQNTRLPEPEALTDGGQAINTTPVSALRATPGKQTDTNNLAIQQFNNETKEQLKNNETINTPQKSTQNISAMAENTIPINKTAKGVFAGATSMAGALGLYLAWRFIQTLV